MSFKMKWDNFRVYLSGPMDYVPDHGVIWRQKATKLLVDQCGLKEVNVFNPCEKPENSVSKDLDEEVRLLKQYRQDKNWTQLEELVKTFQFVDLRLVDLSDLIIANLSGTDRLTGTLHEIIMARQQKKPVFLIDDKGIDHVSAWLIALVGHERIFASLEDAINALYQIQTDGPKSKKDMKNFLIFNLEDKNDD